MKGSPVYGHLNEWNKELFSKPLKELDNEELNRFTGKAISTWGKVDDFKHFLPRIFELTALYKTPYEIWIAFEKLDLAEWKTWNKAEQDSINEYLIALFENILNDESEEAQYNFIDYYTAINHFCIDSDSLVSIWDSTKTKAAVIHLSRLIVEQHYAIFDKGVLQGFNKSHNNVSQLKKWLLNPKTIEMLEKAYFQYQTEKISENISEAESILRNELNKTNANIN